MISRSKVLCLAKSKTLLVSRRSFFLLTAVIISFTSFAQGNLDHGLVGFWNFDDGTAQDFSYNLHDGEIHGSVPFRDGDHGKYITFDGNYENYIQIPHHDDLNFKGSFSIALWIKKNSNKSHQFVIAKGRDVESTYHIRDGGRRFSFSSNNGAEAVTISEEDFLIDEWHYVTFVVDDQKNLLIYYLDGEVVGQEKLSGSPNITTTYPLIFGRHFTTASGRGSYQYPSEACIDEVR